MLETNLVMMSILILLMVCFLVGIKIFHEVNAQIRANEISFMIDKSSMQDLLKSRLKLGWDEKKREGLFLAISYYEVFHPVYKVDRVIKLESLKLLRFLNLGEGQRALLHGRSYARATKPGEVLNKYELLKKAIFDLQ